MIERTEDAERLKTVFDSGIGIMTDMLACQRRMHECVLSRDWVALQKETSILKTLEARMTDCEAERQAIMARLAPEPGAGADFYRISALFEDTRRSALNEKFRELKRLVLLSKTENDVFETYLSHAQSLLKGLIDAVMPSRRNRTYTKNGALRSGPVESLVLNRSF